MNATEMAAWREDFIQATRNISSDIHYRESAEELRKLILSHRLKFTDMRDDPAKFFEAHRLLLAPQARGPGFGIRFTVQFNLFAGSILGLGSDEQVALLDQFEDEGRLGCFCLTERFAGVNSGLIVGTTATWVPDKQQFLLNCPNPGAEKNWISQGLTATKAVVIADLIIKDRHYGPHGFLIDMEKYKGGIVLTDMGKKTTGNDLDNARIKFDNILIPKSALLNRFADIKNDEYFQPTEQKMRLEVIGQRLLTGRLAISQASLVFAQKLFKQTKKYAFERKVWAPNNNKETLGELPQLVHLFDRADYELNKLFDYTNAIEKEISGTLIRSEIPTPELVEKIAVAKISCVETAIRLCFELKQEVGSYGLMDGTGFEHIDFLQCCKFAEGDSRILGQKIARDTMRTFGKSQNRIKNGKVKKACEKLGLAMSSDTKEKNFLKKWNKNWQLVYEVTEAVQEMHMNNALGSSKL